MAIISQRSFRTGDLPVQRRVKAHRHPQRAARALERGLQNVMGVLPRQLAEVQRAGALAHKAQPELLGKLGVERAHLLGGQRQPFFNSAAAFLPMFILSGTWQNIGYNAIIYLAALASVPPELHESAVVDGASRLRRTISIDLAWIMPTIIIQLILRVGNVMNVSFEKAFLMQTDLNVSASEVISTYVYKIGILNRQLSFSTAVGLFKSVVNCALLLIANFSIKRLTGQSIYGGE